MSDEHTAPGTGAPDAGDALVPLVSRRAALRTLGLAAGGVAAAAAACKPTTPDAGHAGEHTGTATETSNKGPDAAAAGRRFFTPHELATATVLVDYLSLIHI